MSNEKKDDATNEAAEQAWFKEEGEGESVALDNARLRAQVSQLTSLVNRLASTPAMQQALAAEEAERVKNAPPLHPEPDPETGAVRVRLTHGTFLYAAEMDPKYGQRRAETERYYKVGDTFSVPLKNGIAMVRAKTAEWVDPPTVGG